MYEVVPGRFQCRCGQPLSSLVLAQHGLGRVLAEAETVLSGSKIGYACSVHHSGHGRNRQAPCHRGSCFRSGADSLYGTIIFNGFGAVFTTILAVNFFLQRRLIGITAREVEDPGTTVRARSGDPGPLAIFFIGSIIVITALIPWERAGVEESPFVVLSRILSVPLRRGPREHRHFWPRSSIGGDQGLYASTRMLWSLANEGARPRS